MMVPRHILLPGLALLTACAGTAEPVGEPSPTACQVPISAYGSKQSLRANPDSVAAVLTQVPVTGTSIGYGPSAGYLEEITLVDGAWKIARATGPDTVSVETGPASDAGAVFLVIASPDAWRAQPLDTPIEGMADLEARLSEIVAASDCISSALPFRIAGVVKDADWSVVGRPSGAKGRLDMTDVTLVGIYDPMDNDRYFMPQGAKVHVHMLTADGAVSGHLNGFSVLTDGTLSLPK